VGVAGGTGAPGGPGAAAAGVADLGGALGAARSGDAGFGPTESVLSGFPCEVGLGGGVPSSTAVAVTL
jgi:hypothetical protein